jgi:two-component system CheB/CheR fusion protein
MNVDGTPIRLIGTLQDVTRQKKNEQELREKQHFIEKIANVTPSLIAAYNIHTGQYLFVNQSLKPLLGYESSDLLEKGAAFIVPLVHPEDLPDLMKQNQQALEMANSPETISNGIEPVVEFKYRLLHKNGEYRWFQTLGTVFNRNAENKVETLLNISVDITEQVRVSQELIRINSELQHQQNKRSIAEEKLKEYARNLKDVNNNLTRSNQELQQFAYAASHDLQEPLRKIIIFSGKLQQEYKELLPEMGKEYINKMVSSSARMTRLIDDLLNFSRVSRSEDKFENVNLNEILQNVLNDFEVVIAQKNAIISYDHLPVIPAIPLQMTQLFQNIISNALKFSKQSSPPMINISLQKEITDELSNFPQLSHNIPYYKLTFKDNGIGFNQTYSEQIFTIFQRLHGKSEYSGTGIGLALCRKIADNHNGIIFARSEEEKGAEFHILLPAQQTVSGVTNTSSAT